MKKRITWEQKQFMYRLWDQKRGLTMELIARRFGCDTSTVSKAIKAVILHQGSGTI